MSPKLMGAVLAGVVGLGSAAVNAAPMVTYDVRFNPAVTTNAGGQALTMTGGVKSILPPTPGQVIGIGVFARIANGDNNHANDGLLVSFGSLVASGTILGNMRGDSPYPTGTITPANDVHGTTHGFDAGAAQSGFLKDQNSDGFFETIGDPTVASQTGSPAVLPWFEAAAGLSPATGADFAANQGAASALTELPMMYTTFTVSSDPTKAIGSLSVQYIPRVKADGPPPVKQTQKITVDGVDMGFTGDDATNVAVGTPASVVPEPGTLSLLGIGAMGLLARRRRTA